MLGSARHIFMVLGLLGAAACTATLPEVHGFGPDSGPSFGSSGSSGSGGGGGSGGASGSGSSGASTSSGGCSACVPGDDGGSSGSSPTGDDASLQDSAAPPTPDSGSPFPPLNFPDGAFSGSSSSGGPSDGGSPCHGMNKICIDPVFDCILQGCGFNSACVGAICQ